MPTLYNKMWNQSTKKTYSVHFKWQLVYTHQVKKLICEMQVCICLRHACAFLLIVD